jgi:putative ABC transport system substrate-binding protein
MGRALHGRHGAAIDHPPCAARRGALSLLGVGLVVARSPGQAQTPAPAARVGVLSDRVLDKAERSLLDAFRSTLGDHGWTEGRNLMLAARYAGEPSQPLPALAAELVAAPVDVIFATTLQAALTAKRASSRVPIVFNVLPDPVEQGLVAALARPGGNVTGVAINSSALIPKRLQLLKEAMPRLSRVAVLLDPSQDEACQAAWDALREPAARMGIRVERFSTGSPTDYAETFARMGRMHYEAVLVPATTRYYGDAHRIADLAASHRMVYLAPVGDLAENRTLLAYGPLQLDAYRRAAIFTDRILRGANPATLPVEQPTRYALVLNNRVARALGVTFPPSLLARADRIIE